MLNKFVHGKETVSVMYWCTRDVKASVYKIDFYDSDRQAVENKAVELTKKDGEPRTVFKVKMLQEYEHLVNEDALLTTIHRTLRGGNG